MILGVGTDIVEIERFEKVLNRFKDRAVKRLFTPAERVRATALKQAVHAYAKRFAAKEAFVKALGTGLAQGISWQDIEVQNLPSGQPILKIFGRSQYLLQEKLPAGYDFCLHLSLSDTSHFAQAIVILEAIKQ